MDWYLLLILLMGALAISLGLLADMAVRWMASWVSYAGRWLRWLWRDLRYWRTWPLNRMAAEKEKRK